MKLTKNSELLMNFFLENKCISHLPQNAKTKTIFKKIYDDLKEADAFIKNAKMKEGNNFYKLNITKIVSVSQILKPKTFSPESFPVEVRQHIDNLMTYNLSYTFSLFDREIKINFIVEDNSPEYQIELYNDYIEKILVWLYIVNEHSSKKCSKKIVVYLYFTSLTKVLPKSNLNYLSEINVNTAFTYTCNTDSEIVVFRKEEWFKVFIHESFHNFALDFSDMNNEECKNKILSIFNVKSDVNLYEAYTEFWAEMMNTMFCSFYLVKHKQYHLGLNEFLFNCDFFINFERTYKLFQMIKTLNFMGLTYKDLYSNDHHSELMRKTLYREKSNVLSYYIITTVMMNNYQGFLSWCNLNNFTLLQFKKTNANVNKFCKFIEKNYKTTSILDSVKCMEHFFTVFKKQKKSKQVDFVFNNMRMSICELG